MPKLSNEIKFYLGIDPGSVSGGASVLGANGKIALLNGDIACIAFKNSTEAEISRWFEEVSACFDGPCEVLKAALEKVHSMPKQSAQSGFTFGASYGFLRGMLAAHKISFIEPSPVKWMNALSCRTGGNKNITKNKAHEMWPKHAKAITHAIADSLLIAEYLRREDR